MRRTGTYGLAPPVTTGLGGGAGLAAVGVDQKAGAMQILGRVADEETKRNIGNQQRETERQAGNAQLGAQLGGMVGFAFGGPLGAGFGSLLGGLAGGLFTAVLMAGEMVARSTGI